MKNTNFFVQSSNLIYLSTVLDGMGTDKPYFNGAEETSMSTVHEIAGARFSYRRQGHNEALTAMGPIKERVVVKVSHIK